MFSLLVLGALILPHAQGQLCADKCDYITSSLSSCSLPALADAGLNLQEKERNVSGLPYHEWPVSGPVTYAIETATEAECFCRKGVEYLDDCIQCFVDLQDD